MDSPVDTHVLNTIDGIPAARMALSLHRLDPRMTLWNLISTGTTDENGYCSRLITRQKFTVGMYKLRFETGQYWESLGQTSFYPYVEIVFTITDLDQRFHVPLHLSRYTYSVYRSTCRQ
ncbi:5-hydroxyisourate hydrolase b [Neoarius graeffei]|uniref:5-hydroxyisourate hydrolase b n=1 Tax=Neoarius graeffei TaxID=443677 RepID=UPI00298C8B3F|nr:5-hydroxyisourate hydrolase b [Neoarius graeffei]